MISLLAENHPLASPAAQRARLAQLPVFTQEITAEAIEVLQMNVGKRCNQTCAHCHVDAGPDRTEVMPDDVVDACLEVLARERIPTLDITGGAPELHPRFREIVARGAASAHVIHRCNLTALDASMPAFLAQHRVHVVASLPFWERERTDAQRGAGVFDRSIAALKRLNDKGYGSELELSLVANPTGAFLPPPQAAFERDFRRALVDVQFTRLLVLTNMPIARFLEWLERTGNTDRYVGKLVSAFNPASVDGLMCKNMVSVAWDGRIYDCDFNQMLEIPAAGAPSITAGWDTARMRGRRVRTGPHCFGCTAGQGSSCGGALTAG